MQLKIVVLSGGSKKWCFDRLESDMMVFCEWLMEGVTFIHPHQAQDEFFHQSHATSFSVNKKDRTGRTGEKIKREGKNVFNSYSTPYRYRLRELGRVRASAVVTV